MINSEEILIVDLDLGQALAPLLSVVLAASAASRRAADGHICIMKKYRQRSCLIDSLEVDSDLLVRLILEIML